MDVLNHDHPTPFWPIVINLFRWVAARTAVEFMDNTIIRDQITHADIARLYVENTIHSRILWKTSRRSIELSFLVLWTLESRQCWHTLTYACLSAQFWMQYLKNSSLYPSFQLSLVQEAFDGTETISQRHFTSGQLHSVPTWNKGLSWKTQYCRSPFLYPDMYPRKHCHRCNCAHKHMTIKSRGTVQPFWRVTCLALLISIVCMVYMLPFTWWTRCGIIHLAWRGWNAKIKISKRVPKRNLDQVTCVSKCFRCDRCLY